LALKHLEWARKAILEEKTQAQTGKQLLQLGRYVFRRSLRLGRQVATAPPRFDVRSWQRGLDGSLADIETHAARTLQELGRFDEALIYAERADSLLAELGWPIDRAVSA